MILVYQENIYDPSMITKNHTSFFSIIIHFFRESYIENHTPFFSRTIHHFFHCSQTKFVAIVLVLFVFLMQFIAWPFSRLTHLTFRLRKRYTDSAQRALSSLTAFRLYSLQVWDSEKLVWRLILMAWRSIIWSWPLPTTTTPNLISPTHLPSHHTHATVHIVQAVRAPCSQRHPPPPPLPSPTSAPLSGRLRAIRPALASNV